ncbi:MAG: S8 family serine peptidase [Acidobacteria bacterium]|nr:S8 family serine peptidase [Acidobacteriota bacterium]
MSVRFRPLFFWLALVACVAVPSWGGRRILPEPGDTVVPNEFLVKLKDRVSPVIITATAGPGSQSDRLHPSVNVFRLQLPAAFADALATKLAALPEVEYVEPNRMRTSSGVSAPNDPLYASQWALSNIKAFPAWRLLPNQYGLTGDGRVRVAVLDTGADCTHPDYSNQGGSSVYSAAGGQLSAELSRALIPTIRPNPACAWQDDHGHGTHTAGIVGAATNNSLGVASLGNGVELIIYKVLANSGSGPDSNIASAIMLAADAGAKVISLSLGGSGYSQSLQDAVNYAWARDSLVVAAAGNSNSPGLFYPAGAHHAVGVAATDFNNVKATFSNFGDNVDLAAPGVSILSTYPTYTIGLSTAKDYHTMSGTSQATPHVSALASMVSMANPGLSGQGITRRLQQTASSSLVGGGWGQFLGYGIIDALGAITGTLRSATTGAVTGQIVDSNGAPAAASLTIGTSTVSVNTTGLFRVKDLAPGTYTMTATGVAGTQTFPVSVSAGSDTAISVRLGVTLGLINGTVSTSQGSLAGAVVQALIGGLVQEEATTGPAGEYTLPLVPGASAKVYDLRVSAPGYSTQLVSGFNVGPSTSQVSDFMLVKYGVIVGTVTDAEGNPVNDADLLFVGPGVSSGASSNAAGTYSSIGLPPGTYAVTASSAGRKVIMSGVVLTGESVAQADFILPVVSVELTPTLTKLAQGQSQQFTATVSGTPNNAVTWSMTPTVGTLSATGLYTAPATIPAPQSVTVTATSVSSPAVGKSSVVTLANFFSLTLSSTSVVGGVQVSGNITVDTAAVADGLVSLSSSNPAVAPVSPAAVVQAGMSVAVFNITTPAVTTTGTSVISATYGGITKSITLTVRPVALSSVSLASSLINGGVSTTTNRVYLDGPAPAGGVVVNLTSSDPAATVPASVTVPAGATFSPYFTITTVQVYGGNKPVTISGSYNGTVKTATLTLRPLAPLALTLSPTSIVGSASTTANKVAIDSPAPAGGATVMLTSSDPSVIVPASVVIPEGVGTSADFTITTLEVMVTTPVTLTATYNGQVVTSILTLRPAVLSSISLSPATVAGGVVTTTNRVNLDGPAGAAGAVVTLASSSPLAVLSVPSITIAPGQSSSPTFSIVTTGVAASTQLTVSASYAGVTRTSTMTLNPPALTTLYLSPGSIVGPLPTTANWVSLDGPAPAGGITVALTASNDTISVPPTVVVPQGAVRSPNFTINTQTVGVLTYATVTAAYKNVERTLLFSVRTPAVGSVSLSPATMAGGVTSTTNRINLDGPAPAGGALVALSSSSPLVTVPSTVSVAAGATASPVFNIVSSAVTSSTPVTVTAIYGGVTKTATLTLTPTALSSVSLSPASLVGQASATSNRVTLNGPAQSNIVVSLSSSDPAAVVPASVTVPAGATTSPVFTITTKEVAANTVVTISASLDGVTRTAAMTLRPAALSSVSLSPPTVAAGVNATSNRVNLDGPAPAAGAVVSLTSSDPAAVVPATVTVVGGAVSSPTFTITTKEVAAPTLVTITATYNGVTKTATMTVRPPLLSSVSLSPATVAGGVNTVSNRVNLDGPAPAAGAVVSLTSSDPAAVVPATVSILPGVVSSPVFTITTANVVSSTTVVITATYNGVTKTANLTITPVALSSISISPTTVVGQVSATLNRVTLSAPAPAGGIVVPLSSDNAAAVVPASVTVLAGQTASPLFTITTTEVAAATPVNISASFGGVTRTGVLTVRPAALSVLTVSPSSVSSGSPATTCRVTLDGPAGAAGVVVTLISSDPVVTPPATVTVPAGATSSPLFSITTANVATSVTATITASYNGVSRMSTLTAAPVALSNIILSPSVVVGPLSTTSNRVNLTGTAPAGGLVVSLSSNNPLAVVPPTVTIAAGSASSPLFTITTSVATVATNVTITATYNGASVSGTLTVRPPVLSVLTLSPTSTKGGTTTTANRVSIDGPAPVGGVIISLSADSGVIVPATVTIPAGSTQSPNFSVITPVVASTTTANVTATYNGSTRTVFLTLTP